MNQNNVSDTKTIRNALNEVGSQTEFPVTITNSITGDKPSLDAISGKVANDGSWNLLTRSLGVSITDEDVEVLESALAELTRAMQTYNQNNEYTIKELNFGIEISDGIEHVSLDVSSPVEEQ